MKRHDTRFDGQASKKYQKLLEISFEASNPCCRRRTNKLPEMSTAAGKMIIKNDETLCCVTESGSDGGNW